MAKSNKVTDVAKSLKNRYQYMHRDVKENIEYYLMMSIPLLSLVVFKFFPAYGMLIAFQNYVPGAPILGEGAKWVGLKWMKQIVRDPYIWRGIVNSLRLFAIGTLFMFAPVFFAVLTAEVRNRKFQGFTRIFCYMPNFMSEIVVCGFFIGMLQTTGIITQMVAAMGFKVTNLLTVPAAFPWIYTIINCWQSFGWGSLLYSAAIAGIDPGLYESAQIDGAGKMAQIWHVTLPALKPMIIYSFIMRFSGMLGSDVTQIIRMYNSSVYSVADTIGSYLYRETLLGSRYSYGSAAGLMISVINFIALYVCNKICQKVSEFSMW